MKAIEAPEKIYLSQEKDEDGCYVDLMWHKHPYEDKENIQYVRTDAFIEKAAAYLEEHKEDVETEDHGIAGWITDYFIENFKKYMKGE